MTDPRPELLAFIIDNPADDHARLVYADACEEQGDVERAEFVRCQIELGRLENEKTCREICEPPKYEGCPNKDLRRKEAFALYGGKSRWLAPFKEGDWHGITNHQDGCSLTLHLKPDWNDVKVVFRRGFVAEVHCRLADWLGSQCLSCNGTGGFRGFCKPCGGTGVVGGHGGAIVQAQPVEVVRATDRMPQPDATGALRVTWQCTDPDLPSCVPYSLLDLMQTDSIDRFTWVVFDSEADAQAALSAALIQWTKGRIKVKEQV